MSQFPGPPDTPSKLRRALGIGVTVFCVLVAVGVAALFLTLMSARKTGGAESLADYAPTTTWQTTPVAPSLRGEDCRDDVEPSRKDGRSRLGIRCVIARDTCARNPSSTTASTRKYGSHSHVRPTRLLVSGTSSAVKTTSASA